MLDLDPEDVLLDGGLPGDGERLGELERRAAVGQLHPGYTKPLRACSSGDRARASGARGRRFDSYQAHLQPVYDRSWRALGVLSKASWARAGSASCPVSSSARYGRSASTPAEPRRSGQADRRCRRPRGARRRRGRARRPSVGGARSRAPPPPGVARALRSRTPSLARTAPRSPSARRLRRPPRRRQRRARRPGGGSATRRAPPRSARGRLSGPAASMHRPGCGSVRPRSPVFALLSAGVRNSPRRAHASKVSRTASTICCGGLGEANWHRRLLGSASCTSASSYRCPGSWR